MLKRYQLRNTNPHLKVDLSDNVLVVILSVMLFAFVLIVATPLFASFEPVVMDTTEFYKSDIQDLYVNEIVEEKTFYARHQINTAITDEAVDFYTKFTGNRKISKAIIDSAIENDIPVNLAFSVAWKESKYNPMAYNDNGGRSADRGLFQLNDGYRDWTKEQFYDIHTNVHEGTRYISEMVELNDGDFIYALYCYNAGPTRVRRDGIIPDRTKVYVTEILEYEDMLTQEFNKWISGKA